MGNPRGSIGIVLLFAFQRKTREYGEPIMGKFDSFLCETPGYFRHSSGENFPWTLKGKSVWFALQTVEEGKIQSYGFTTAIGQRANLRALLQSLGGTEAVLMGVWTGAWCTHLFILDIQVAMARLQD